MPRALCSPSPCVDVADAPRRRARRGALGGPRRRSRSARGWCARRARPPSAQRARLGRALVARRRAARVDPRPGATATRRARPIAPAPHQGHSPAPRAVASTSLRRRRARPVASASAWRRNRARGHPAVDAQLVQGRPVSARGRLDEVGAALGDALEHRAREVGARRAPREPEEPPARAEVPPRACRAPTAPARTPRRRRRHDAAHARRPPPASPMSPRSSRSHSTQCPADSTIASTPQVIAPARSPRDDREACPRRAAARGRGRAADAPVEHARPCRR